MQSGLEQKARTAAEFFKSYVMSSYTEYYQMANSYTKDFDGKDRIELQFISGSGRIQVSSSGLTAGTSPGTDDISQAISSGKLAVFYGRDPQTGEKVMSVSYPLPFNGKVVGVMSRADLEKKLGEKGASAQDARYAAEWLEAIGGLNDADYAALLVRHCAGLGYGPARYRDELRRHGLDRELWDDAIAQAPDPQELAERYLQNRFKGGVPDEKERKRAVEALARRGFAWSDVKRALTGYSEDHFND